MFGSYNPGDFRTRSPWVGCMRIAVGRGSLQRLDRSVHEDGGRQELLRDFCLRVFGRGYRCFALRVPEERAGMLYPFRLFLWCSTHGRAIASRPSLLGATCCDL